MHPIKGRPLLRWVAERIATEAPEFPLWFAVDDEILRACVVEAGFKAILTSPAHQSGTDRIAEVARSIRADAYVNIQGDEPLVDPAVIDAVAERLAGSEMTTAATPIADVADYANPNVVKVVVGLDGHALYFSRRTIPYLRDHAGAPETEQLAAFPFLKHLGIYGYRAATLQRIVAFPVSALEQAERLEQLRPLEHGIRIAVARVQHDSIGVDTPADVARVEAMLATRGE